MPIHSQAEDIIILNANEISTMMLVPDFDFGDPGFGSKGVRMPSEPIYLSFFVAPGKFEATAYLTTYEQYPADLSRFDIEHMIYLLASRLPKTVGSITSTKMVNLDRIISYSGGLYRANYKGDVTKATVLTTPDGNFKREWTIASTDELIMICIQIANRIFKSQ